MWRDPTRSWITWTRRQHRGMFLLMIMILPVMSNIFTRWLWNLWCTKGACTAFRVIQDTTTSIKGFIHKWNQMSNDSEIISQRICELNLTFKVSPVQTHCWRGHTHSMINARYYWRKLLNMSGHLKGVSSSLSPFQIFVVSDAGLYQSITEAAG